MADDGVVVLYDGTIITTDQPTNPNPNPYSIKVGLTQILRGGAIVEISDPTQAKIAENAGACCISIVGDHGRMSNPSLIKQIKRTVSIPVIGKSRVGHFVEAQIIESSGSDYIDENEVLLIADEDNFINKHNFRVPFICGTRNLGGALRRIREGAAMIRTQGDLSGSGNIAETVGNVRKIMGHVRMLNNMDDDEVFTFAKNIGAPYDLVAQTKQMGRLPVVHFASGGIVTPADAALMMQLGCDGVFIGVEVFDGVSDPFKRVRAIVEAVRNYNDPAVLVDVCTGFSDAMARLNVDDDNRVVEV
ncbi:pyridoxal 5'-phosphate synthase-like subunit PDX1.2 [Beta vulgaris subsp. vulgaris]|uniref:pyridoxal 5'-phosphate synthase-like subunit PDX1.2 n=1 Tax=Beta vulgaris subsp. vulgaris TaxID=3555 RepID=UPI00053F503F|nr:pyridoxal 5'-phosphate synthase-like subunit PDX1.2 [Beta vulgaris subsp. vulgaris]XP_057247667.1 pyridoxal 5'-phosphate synthase-like subunit PDX1.2 [Beta vulgaris subsp. vulgaris]XP_057247668.1 pyridoxal 5'-phosphate synthase-like subunit PDX1.2 [Beta vulgaris subsp. vulgaris]